MRNVFDFSFTHGFSRVIRDAWSEPQAEEETVKPFLVFEPILPSLTVGLLTLAAVLPRIQKVLTGDDSSDPAVLFYQDCGTRA